MAEQLKNDMDSYSMTVSTKKTITITVRSNRKTHKLKYEFKKSSTINDIKVAFKDEINPNKNIEKMVLRKTGKELLNEKTLSFYGITRNKTLTMTTRQIGGTQERKMDTTDGDIVISNNQCCMLYIDGPNSKMSCGCIVSAQGMMGWIKKIFDENESNYEVLCPSHTIEWDWDLCCKIAGMTDKEYEQYDTQHEIRSTPPEKECPQCFTSCERPDNLKEFRVNCPDCSGGDWCWECEKPWIGGGFSVCGNKGCITEEINITLKECPLKDLGGSYGNVMVPEVRACVGCFAFIEHEKDCKHMTCEECKKEFCFACLGVFENGKWPCGRFDFKCPVAARQQLK